VLGTRRRKGDYQGTMQTPGIGDLYGFLPPPRYNPAVTTWTDVWVEAKAPGGRASDEQKEFRSFCLQAGTPHVLGTVDAFIAYLITGGWMRPDQVAHYRLPPMGGGVIGSSGVTSTTGERDRKTGPDSTDGLGLMANTRRRDRVPR
jgi:hypothetical protein